MAWREECAVFGAWDDFEAGQMTYLGLYAQQHRGQESAGIVSLDNGYHVDHKGLGLVGDIFDEAALERLKGRAAIGHVRYSTTGRNLLANAQPLTAQLHSGPIAIAHNGNIVNSAVLKEELVRQGAIFQGSNDTEVLLHLIARQGQVDIKTGIVNALKKMHGAFSMVVLTNNAMFVARDPYGFRPLVLGRRKVEGREQASTVVASETCAFDLIGAKYEREIAPGELYWIDEEGEGSVQFAESTRTAHCVFEHVYFSRPDSKVFDRSVYETRKQMGKVLSDESGVEADIVVPVPDSGVTSAIGYSEASGIPFELGIIRNHYIGRTFIQPSQSIRSFGVKIKLNPQREILAGKRVIVIDDSLVRGTTSQKIINLVRQAGAKEVHFRVASPPTTGGCYYGVDTPKRRSLIAAVKTQEEIREFIGADTLAYLSVEGMMKAVNAPYESYCAACFDGKYPTELYGSDL